MLLLTDLPARTLVVTELGGGGGGCNRVHLHIVFVLLYVLWVCRSVGVLSCVYVSRSFTYALRVVI